MDREQIINALAAKFGPHKGWNGKRSVVDGNDSEGACTTTFPAADGSLAIRALTYGEIADAILAAESGSRVARDAEVLHSEHHPGTLVPSLDSCPEHDRAGYEDRVRKMSARTPGTA